MPQVLIADQMSPLAQKVFEQHGIVAEVRTGLSEDELRRVIGQYDGLVVRSATKVTARVLEAGVPRLKVVGRAGIGVDNVDVEAATRLGVVVMNAPFGNAVTTAEHAIAMMMALARHIPAADRSMRAGKWEKNRFMGMELAGKTLGLIGCGNIGSIVADRAHGLKMKVIVYDPYLSDERARLLGVEKVSFDELLQRADVISLHTPLTPETRNILSREALLRTRPGVRIVNCARGGLVDEQALYDLIRAGHVAGAALDVFAEEPLGESPLRELDEVVLTPHLGASTTEAQEKVAIQIAEQIADFLLYGAISNAINMPAVSAEEAPRLRPYTKLAEQLGSFAGQLTETGLRRVTITYGGEAAALNTRPLTQIILKGLLAPQLEGVNMVSAPVIARARGIDVATVERENIEGYRTLISVEVETERRERCVAGTLFQGSEPRIVTVDGIPMEARLGEHMLFVRNVDRPGLIGALGTLLGEAGVNIASFHLGRREPGGEALALVEVDQPVGEELLARIRALPHVLQARALRFS